MKTLLGCFLFTWVMSGCVTEPASNSQLIEGGSLEQTSEAGLALGRLSALDRIETGANDFQLELSSLPPSESVLLSDVVAVMPGHGHRALPDHLELTNEGYRIVNLELPMSGVWELEGSLLIGDQADAISFAIDVP
jgi:hypothetical protein